MKTLTMKGKDNHNFGLVIIDSDRTILPPQNDEYRTIPGLDIKQHIPRELGNIELKVVFFRENKSVKEWHQARLDIVAWLYSKQEIQVEVDDEPGMHFIGKVTSSDVPTKYRPDVSFEVTFTLHPFRYGKKVESLRFNALTTTVQNEGTYETPGVITVRSTASMVSPTFTMNGAALKYTGTIASNSLVTIDSGELEFRIDGVLKVLEVTGRFTPFRPGPNTIQLSSAYAGFTQIEFTERFL